MLIKTIDQAELASISGGYFHYKPTHKPTSSPSKSLSASNLSYGANFVTFGGTNYNGNYQTTFNVGENNFNTGGTTNGGGGPKG